MIIEKYRYHHQHIMHD